MADSPDSITASVPSRMALATSVASARVGMRLVTIDSSICVAVMTGLPGEVRPRDQGLLGDGDALDGHLDAEVAARHHHAVGRREDLVVVVQRARRVRSSR